MVNRTNPFFSSGWRDIAAAQAKMKSGRLTPNEVREMYKIEIDTTEKTQELASSFFQQLDEIKSGMNAEREAVSKEILDLSQKMISLDMHWNELAPQDIEEELTSLVQRASLISRSSEDQELAPWIQDIVQITKTQLAHSVFRFAHPSVMELSLDSLEPTFANNLSAVAEKIRQDHSLEAFQALDPAQQREILRYTQKEGI